MAMADWRLIRYFHVTLKFGKEIIWPGSLDSTLGRLLGALSFFAISRYAFDFGLSAVATEMFKQYDAVLRVLFGWLDPMIRDFTNYIMQDFRIELEFNQYWRHICVVLEMLFVRDASVALANGRSSVALIRLVLGTIIAAVASISASIKIIDISTIVQNMLFATIPTIGIYIYDLFIYVYSALFQLKFLNDMDDRAGRSPLSFLRSAVRRASIRCVLGLSVTYVVFLLPIVHYANSPAGGLIAVGAATVVNASYWLWRGARFASREAKNGRNWFHSFKASEAGRFGAAVSGVLLWACIFAALNAGMDKIGL